MENILPEQWKSARIRAVKQKVLRMINTVSSFYMLGVAEAGMLLQFPFLVREKGALIDRQSLSCISLPQVATGLRFACRARSVGGAFSQTKLCTWMTATLSLIHI